MRTSIKAVALAAILLGLTACEKPNPEVTVFSGARSVHAPAACWMPEATSACAMDPNAAVTELVATSGATLGISVDSDVAEAGWRPSLIVNGQEQQLTSGLLHKRYWRMQYPEVALTGLAGQPLQLVVYSMTEDGKNVRGYWNFSLDNTESLDNA